MTDFTYDAGGRMTAYSDGQSSATYAYDGYGRLVGEPVTYGPGLTRSPAFTYTGNDLIASYTAPDATTYQYTYAGGSNLATVSAPDLGVITYNEFTWFGPRRITYPGGATKEVTYGGPMKPVSIAYRAPGGADIARESYAYDAVGQLTQRVSLNGVISYGYDKLGQVVSAASTVTGIPGQSFGYDLAFNRTAASGVSNVTYVTDASGRPLGNQLATYGSSAFSYDAAGDVTLRTDAGVPTEYVYGPQQELLEVRRSGAVVARYAYDPLGRRLWKETGGARTYFHWAGQTLVAEARAEGGRLVVTRTYGHRPGQNDGLEPLFLRNESGNYYFYACDQLGAPLALFAANGAVVWSARYDLAGRAAVISPAVVASHLRGSNQYFDAETGLHYNLHRYYDPVLGRYLQSDPLGLRGDSNPYTFAYNAPPQLVDVDGAESGFKPPEGVCIDLRADFGVEGKLPGPAFPALLITKGDFKFSAKVQAQGRFCLTACCTKVGLPRLDWSGKGSITAEVSAAYSGSSGEIDLFGVKGRGGVLVEIAAKLSVSLSAEKPACKDAGCVSIEGKGSVSLSVGGGVEGDIGDGAFGPLSRFAGAKAKIGLFAEASGSIKKKCKFCPPSRPQCDPAQLCLSGEIYAQARIKWNRNVNKSAQILGRKGETGGFSDVDFRFTVLKLEQCWDL